MRALVIGFGSIGARHAAVLAELGLEVAVVSRREVSGFSRFATIDAGLGDWRPDYVVLASRTSEHRADLAAIAAAGFAGLLLVEKPLLDVDAEVPAGLPATSFVGYNLRFHPAVAALREALSDTRTFAVNAYVGQHLPDWRPATDYRQSYSAQKALGGGVLRDLSHELDLVNWLFGPWQALTAAGGKCSDLEIDSDDVFSLVVALDRCPVASISMNYLDDRVTRGLAVQTAAGTQRIDFVAGTLESRGETRRFEIARNDTFIGEHRAILDGRDDRLCRLEDGADVMAIILAAERAAADRTWVARAGRLH